MRNEEEKVGSGANVQVKEKKMRDVGVEGRTDGVRKRKEKQACSK